MSGEGARENRVLAGVLVGFALAILALAFQLPGPTAADPVGPRGFPMLLALVVLACGAALGLSRRATPDGDAEPRGPLAPRQLLGGIALTAGYLAVLEPAGYLLATPPYLATLLLAHGGVPARTLLLTALGLPAALYLLFAVVMRVPLPPGLLEPLLRQL